MTTSASLHSHLFFLFFLTSCPLPFSFHLTPILLFHNSLDDCCYKCGLFFLVSLNQQKIWGCCLKTTLKTFYNASGVLGAGCDIYACMLLQVTKVLRKRYHLLLLPNRAATWLLVSLPLKSFTWNANIRPSCLTMPGEGGHAAVQLWVWITGAFMGYLDWWFFVGKLFSHRMATTVILRYQQIIDVTLLKTTQVVLCYLYENTIK